MVDVFFEGEYQICRGFRENVIIKRTAVFKTVVYQQRVKVL